MNALVSNTITDWWIFGATIFAGIATALATMGAVIYTNKKTIRQLKEQKEEYEKEKKEKHKLNNMVIIKPTLRLTSFMDMLEEMASSNNWERRLLFSGTDGFDFYDDTIKSQTQINRILKISNTSDISINSIKMITKSTLRNLNTDELINYDTLNEVHFLRGGEDIVIRLINQAQWDKVIDMNNTKTPSELDFQCLFEYSTLANQRIIYSYKIIIRNDTKIEIINDGIEKTLDIDSIYSIQPTVFRNLQDSISRVDRINFHWEKVGKAQARGMMSQFNSNNLQQVNNSHEKQPLSKDGAEI